MNSQNIIEIIETICNKLDIAIDSFSDFVPELAKYKISSSVFWVLASAIVISLSVYAIKYVIHRANRIIENKSKNYYYRDELQEYPSVCAISIIGGSLIIIFLFVLLFNIRNIVVWVSSPQASAVNYVLSYFN